MQSISSADEPKLQKEKKKLALNEGKNEVKIDNIRANDMHNSPNDVQ